MTEKYKIRYYLNIGNHFRGDKTPPRLIKKVLEKRKEIKIRLYADSKVIFVKIPHSYFPDNRATSSFYYFSMWPGASIYTMYQKYMAITNVPDPLYSGTIDMNNQKYAKYVKSCGYEKLIFKVLLKMAESYILRRYVTLDPLEMRALWDVEKIARNGYNIMFSYVGALNPTRVYKDIDIHFIPQRTVDMNEDYLSSDLLIRDFYTILYLLSVKNNGDSKRVFLKNVLLAWRDAIGYMTLVKDEFSMDEVLVLGGDVP